MATKTLSKLANSLNDDATVRVEDYLNDKLQTHADLETLDSLLQNVQQQQELLRKQLADAEIELDQAVEAADTQKSDLSSKTQAFHKQQKEIDRRLLIVTNSDTSDDAVQRFSESMERLGTLDIAKGYVELLAKVERLSEETRTNFKVSPQAALEPYVKLQSLTNALKKAQPTADFAAPHLIDHVERSTKTLWLQMKSAFAGNFEKTLKKMKWPGKDVTMEGGLTQEWSDGVMKLLELQGPELQAYEAERGEPGSTREELVLLPLEVMVRPLAQRFKYHFEGDRPTNKLDKPEYFLGHISELLNTYEEFFSTYLQPLLRQHFRDSNIALNPLFIDSTSALVAALLLMVRQKIISILPQVTQSPSLLSHLMHQLMEFDNSLREDWGYDGGQGAEGWKGLAWEVLVKQDWFGRWVQVEKDFALARYDEIITPADSGEIDYESVDPGITKPTKAAIRVNDLLETVTDLYRPLTSFSQKMRFLIDIQISIFDSYHSRLRSSLEAYISMTSRITRTVQGISKEDQASLQGINGLDRLCRVYGSADYLERKMSDWSDDVFFLELWEELQYRARDQSRDGQTVGRDLSIEEVTGKTSTNVGSEGDSGALFDETSAAYHRLRVRTEEIILEAISYDVRESLRPYGRINPWSTVSEAPTTGTSISAELDGTIQLLSSYLDLLAKVLAEPPLRRIARQVALAVQSFFWDNIIMRNNFSPSGTAQLWRDITSVWAVFDKHVSNGYGAHSMKRLKEGHELLSLPSSPEQQSDSDGEGPKSHTLKDVEASIFRDNTTAREMLAELGLDTLSEVDARAILERRIEWE